MSLSFSFRAVACFDNKPGISAASLTLHLKGGDAMNGAVFRIESFVSSPGSPLPCPEPYGFQSKRPVGWKECGRRGVRVSRIVSGEVRRSSPEIAGDN